MTFLIDTHTFLWFINDNDQLSDLAQSLLESDADLWLSSASLWEMAIKISVQKLTFPQFFSEFIPEQLSANKIEVLPPTIQHFATVAQLPLHHRDPFDRLIIAQAITVRASGDLSQGVSVISIDAAFDTYGIQRLW